jgi:hypothetical protein
MKKTTRCPFVKSTLICILFVMANLPKTHGQTINANSSGSLRSKEYVNDFYHFSVVVPDKWKLFGQIVNDTIKHRAIVDWGLPSIYSDVENAEIENSVTITAYKMGNIGNVDELIQSEYLRVDPTKYTLEVDSATKNARFIYGTVDGRNYKGKSYFVFKDGIGYVVNFMATPGTFDKNLPLFEKFFKAIRFL